MMYLIFGPCFNFNFSGVFYVAISITQIKKKKAVLSRVFRVAGKSVF